MWFDKSYYSTAPLYTAITRAGLISCKSKYLTINSPACVWNKPGEDERKTLLPLGSKRIKGRHIFGNR